MEMRTHEFAVLNHLAEAGPISQQELGQALRINPSNLVGLLDLLEADGLLVRARDPRRPAPPSGGADQRRAASAWPAPGAPPSRRRRICSPPSRRPSARSCTRRWSGSWATAAGAGADRDRPANAVDRARLLALFRPYRRRLARCSS